MQAMKGYWLEVLFLWCLATACVVSSSGAAQHPFKSPEEHSAIGSATSSPYRWLNLPPRPSLPAGATTSWLDRPDGARIWHAFWPAKAEPKKDPVVILHGGFAAAEWHGLQIQHILDAYPDRAVIAIDSRGQGRSTFGTPKDDDELPTLGYNQMTDDVVAVLDTLGVEQASIFGWSDGAIIVIDFLFRYPSRLGRAFAFSANYNTSGTYSISSLFVRYQEQARELYESVNPDPDWNRLNKIVSTMWTSEPNWSPEDFLRAAKADQPNAQSAGNTLWVPSQQDPGKPNASSRVWLVDGSHEEAVRLPQLYDMSTWLPQSPTLLLPAVSHFAFLQAPQEFNKALDDWLNYSIP